jgi:Flp pilus assembly protein TadG
MRKRALTTWHVSALSNSGSEIAETAMILPLLFVVLLAIFWFGQAFRFYGTITHAAREGARAAVAPVCATCATQNAVDNAVNAVNGALSAAKLDPTKTLAPVPVPALCACGTQTGPCTTGIACVPGTSTTSNVCVQPNVQLSYTTPKNGAPGAGTCGTSVSFTYKYPFHFTLPCWPQPCTSLDLQKITLPAQAEMREETQ